jgi:replicative DNA helicase
MSTEGTDDEAAAHVDAEEPIEVEDLLDDPRTDVEALCLCALLWSPTDTASDVSDLLRSTDFDRGVYGELFEVITAQVRSGAPHDPASIAATLTQSGRTGGDRGAQLTRALSSVTIAGAVPETVGYYTVAVLSAGYRRGFHRAAQSMAAAAEQLSQDQLFDHLLSIGRAQRAATERLHHGTTLLSPTRRANGSPHSSRNTEPTTSEGTTTS